MTHIKCSQCGLNNWDGAEVCERCGFALDKPAPEPVTPPEPVTTPPERPDYPVFLTLGSSAPPPAA